MIVSNRGANRPLTLFDNYWYVKGGKDVSTAGKSKQGMG